MTKAPKDTPPKTSGPKTRGPEKPSRGKTAPPPGPGKPEAKKAGSRASKAPKPAPKTSAAPRPVKVAPLLLTTPFELGIVGPGGLAYFDGKLLLAGREKIFSAAPDARGWTLLHDIPWRPLEPANAEAAERLGLVQDGPAAAAMGTELQGAHGLGPFCLFQRPGTRTPALFLGSRSVAGGEILCTADGATFAPVSERGLGDPSRMALTTLVTAGGWLITAPGPLQPRDRKAAAINAGTPVTIHASRDPAPGTWQEVALPGLGEGVTGGVTALGVAHGYVYAAIEDADCGFTLWRADPAPEAPWDWHKVIDRGGYRFSLAPQVTRMAEFNGDLYLSTGISDSGFGKDRAGPAAAELLKVAPGGGWEVIVGAPRFSPDGLKVPLSGIGPGFGNGWATLILGLAEHAGVLYAGTRHVEAEYQLYTADPEGERVRLSGGCALWASTDGEDWTPVMTGGGGNPALVAVRALISTPEGLAAALSANAALDSYDAGMEVQPGNDDEVQIWMGKG